MSTETPPELESAQALRLKRLWIIARAYYGSALALLSIAYALGLLTEMAAMACVAVFVLINAFLFLVIRSGFNLRFVDADLRSLQAYAAVTTALFAAYHLDDGRGLWLLLCTSPLVFGAHQLRRVDLVRLALYTLAAYALVVNLVMRLRPSAVQNVYVEWFSWVVLAFVLLVAASHGTRMSRFSFLEPAPETAIQPTKSRRPVRSDDAAQHLRMQQFMLAARVFYGMALALLGLAYGFGLIDPAPALAGVLLIVSVNAGLYFVFRSGANLRFEDPSLTLAQSCVAITAAMFITYHLNDGRGLWLLLSLSPFLFGIYQLRHREFFGLALYTVAAYALVVNLVMRLRPEAVHNVFVEWFSWAALAIVLGGVVTLAARLSELRRHLVSRTQALSTALDRINTIATRDALTGLYNRAVFTESLRHALAQLERHGRRIALLFIDSDRFKQINDTYGHQVGDDALRELARRISSALRVSDVVGRLGGDEFVVMIEDFHTTQDLLEVAQKIVASVSAPMRIEDIDIANSVSIGIAIAPQHGRSEVELMRHADAAMYHAKETGRNRVALYVDGLGRGVVERVQLQADLRQAIAANQLQLHYQPKVSLADNRITGVEALMRWQHPTLGFVPPDRFIPVAEETGDIVALGQWALRTACAQARHWSDAHGLQLGMAVNLSPRQLRDADLPAQVAEALRESAFDPRRFELEITESMVMLNPDHALEQMQRLRALGIRLSLDDFGTGYSSLSVLKRFPVQDVKVDRSFVKDLPGSEDDVGLTRAIISMAHHLRLSTTAEGVETAPQLEFLRSERCESYQGYFCSRPLPGDALAAFVKAYRPG